MSDNFIEEIKEEIRNEQIQRIWRDYGHVIIGMIVAIVISTVGYIVWYNYKTSQLNNQAIAFETQLDARASAQKETDFTSLMESGSKGISLLSSYLAASEKSAFDASQDLKKLSEDASFKPFYRDLATLQSIMRKFNETNGRELLSELAAFDDSKSIVQAQAQELKGYAHLKLNDRQAALAAFQAVLTNQTATQSMTLRARAMIEMLAG